MEEHEHNTESSELKIAMSRHMNDFMVESFELYAKGRTTHEAVSSMDWLIRKHKEIADNGKADTTKKDTA